MLEMFPAIWPDYALAHKANVIEMLSQVQKTISQSFLDYVAVKVADMEL